ncbi:uncharacterized protein ACOB8E_007623 [Sarcophilus harrisii]
MPTSPGLIGPASPTNSRHVGLASWSPGGREPGRTRDRPAETQGGREGGSRDISRPCCPSAPRPPPWGGTFPISSGAQLPPRETGPAPPPATWEGGHRRPVLLTYLGSVTCPLPQSRHFLPLPKPFLGALVVPVGGPVAGRGEEGPQGRQVRPILAEPAGASPTFSLGPFSRALADCLPPNVRELRPAGSGGGARATRGRPRTRRPEPASTRGHSPQTDPAPLGSRPQHRPQPQAPRAQPPPARPKAEATSAQSFCCGIFRFEILCDADSGSSHRCPEAAVPSLRPPFCPCLTPRLLSHPVGRSPAPSA